MEKACNMRGMNGIVESSPKQLLSVVVPLLLQASGTRCNLSGLEELKRRIW
jgi:hypothetical protein